MILCLRCFFLSFVPNNGEKESKVFLHGMSFCSSLLEKKKREKKKTPFLSPCRVGAPCPRHCLLLSQFFFWLIFHRDIAEKHENFFLMYWNIFQPKDIFLIILMLQALKLKMGSWMVENNFSWKPNNISGQKTFGGI